MPSDKHKSSQRPSLREDVMAIDRQILNLLLRRHNMLKRMQGTRGHLIPLEEKQLREAWQAQVAKVSSDPNLSTQFFDLIQNLRFFPKPLGPAGDQKPSPTRQAFNLAPAKKPVYFSLNLPADHFQLHAALVCATFCGGEVKIPHTLMHDGQHSLVRILKELGASIETCEDALTLKAQKLTDLPDLSLHIGPDIFNFYLLAAQYLVRSSRVRFTAEDQAKKQILTPIARFCPSLGARLSYGVPRVLGFPIRLECSGVLPKTIQIPNDLPSAFVLALILALPNAETETTVDLTEHSQAQQIIKQASKILTMWEAKALEIGKNVLQITPANLNIPCGPNLPADLSLTSFIASLPLLLGGICTLHGRLPNTSTAQDLQAIFKDLGLKITSNQPGKIHLQSQGLAQAKKVQLPEAALKFFKNETLELMVMLACALALTDHDVKLPEALPPEALDFVDAVGLTKGMDDLLLKKDPTQLKIPLYTAPSAAWALAYATCAALRQVDSFRLSNAGIITKIWPKYWALYNGLPSPVLQKDASAPTKPKRVIAKTTIKLADDPDLKDGVNDDDDDDDDTDDEQ